MNNDSRFCSGTTQSQLMTSLREYGSIKNDPLQAFLASTHVRSRSPWQQLDDISAPWQHASLHPDDLSNSKSFQPWKWHSELLPLDSCMTSSANKSVVSGENSPRSASAADTGNEQRHQQQQQHHQQPWSGGVYGAPRLWPSSYGDYDTSSCYQQQSGYSGAAGLSTAYPLVENKQPLYPVFDAAASSACNRSPTDNTTSAAMAAAARMQAVARYFNDRWYSATSGYGPPPTGFDPTNGISLGCSAGSRASNGSAAAEEPASGLYASMTGRYSTPSSTLSGLQHSNNCSSAVSGLAACEPLLTSTSPEVALGQGCGPFSSGWMWNVSPAACPGVNTNYLLNSCSTNLDRKQSAAAEYRDDTKSDFRLVYSETIDGKESYVVDDQKQSPEAKRKRAHVDSKHASAASTPTTSQRAPRTTASGITSSSGGSTRSSASACECPNCREADRIGGATGEQLRRLGQHSCHVPGCGKVYGKTSHLKAHLHWHNAGSSVSSSSNNSTSSGGNGVIREPSASSSGKRPADQRSDAQRHQPATGADCHAQQQDRLATAKRPRKKSRAVVTVSGNGETASCSGLATPSTYGQSLPTGSSKTRRNVANEATQSVNSAGVAVRYDLGTGSASRTDENNRSPSTDVSRRSPEVIFRTSSSDLPAESRSTLKYCRPTLNCDVLSSVSGRMVAGLSMETGSSLCSSERLTSLQAVNG